MSRQNSNEQPLTQCKRANISQLKRKRSITNCHQCHKNDKDVIRCLKCKKQYCIRCVKWYPTIKETFAERCAICRGICNCGACLQSEGPSNIHDLSSTLEEKYDLSAHVINVLLPTLKKHIEEAETQDDDGLDLVVRAEAVVGLYESTDGGVLETTCSCRTSDAQSGNSLKAASREDGKDNHLCCLVAADAEKSDLGHFQTHFSNGQPVIVHDVLSGGSGFSWEPAVIERAIRKPLQKASNSMDLSVTNCSSYCEEKINIHKFFKGYTNGLFDHHGHPKVLTLEWRSSKTFREELPRYYGELVRCLPFKPYTHSVSSGRIPVKMFVSYGPRGGIENCGTKLQYDVFDRDIPKLEEYLHKHAEEMKHSSPLCQMVHPDHQDTVYLTMEHKKKLKDEYGIEPWTFVQKLGDAVFVPIGCSYQMRNLKSCIQVAVDFVSPESLSESENLFEGRRVLPSDNFQKEYILKMKKLLRDTITQAVENWEKIPWGLGGETFSLGFLTRKAKMMRLLMMRESHKFSHVERKMLEDEIQNFLNASSTSSSRIS